MTTTARAPQMAASIMILPATDAGRRSFWPCSYPALAWLDFRPPGPSEPSRPRSAMPGCRQCRLPLLLPRCRLIQLLHPSTRPHRLSLLASPGSRRLLQPYRLLLLYRLLQLHCSGRFLHPSCRLLRRRGKRPRHRHLHRLRQAKRRQFLPSTFSAVARRMQRAHPTTTNSAVLTTPRVPSATPAALGRCQAA